MDDRELLQRFVESRNEQAFAALVRRHIDMVYSAARRQVFDPASAEDVTQGVFILLANKARSIRNANALPGWLLVATRGIALNHRRSEGRRRRREQEAAVMKNQESPVESDWEQISPLLDDAVARLKPADREALTLRYFQNREVAEVASLLGISPLAAQKRVSRAIQRLREILTRRGISTSTAAISTMLLSSAVAPAPAALAAQIAGTALANAVIATASHVSILKGAAVFMAMSNTKLAVTVAILAVIILAGAGSMIVLQQPSPTPVTPAVVPAQPLTRAEQETRLRELFALLPGQDVKRVPWTADRTAYIRPGTDRRTPDDSDEFITFMRWEENGNRPMSRRRKPVTFSDVLIDVADIWPQDTTLTYRQLTTVMDGDWAYRGSADTASRVAALSALVPEIIEAGKVLRVEPMLRNVIVVRGMTSFKSMNDPDRRRKRVAFHSGPITGSAQLMALETLRIALQRLGSAMGRPIVFETSTDLDQNVESLTYASALNLTQGGRSPDFDEVAAVLESVAEQTSLEFKQEQRTVPVWRVVPGKP